MLLASDDANKEFSNPKNPDAVLQVTFYQKTSPHNFNIALNAEHALCGDFTDCPHLKNPENGRPIMGRSFPMPEMVAEDFVHISIPGKPEFDIHTPVEERHKLRFPQQWERYQRHMTEAEQATGTPLSEWKDLSQHQIEFLKAARFYTVEQVAGCSDGQIQALGMNGNILRQKARGLIISKRDSGDLAQKDKEIADLKASIAQQVADAVKQAMEAQLPAAPPKRKGRPPKVRDGANAAATGQPSAG